MSLMTGLGQSAFGQSSLLGGQSLGDWMLRQASQRCEVFNRGELAAFRTRLGLTPERAPAKRNPTTLEGELQDEVDKWIADL